MINPYLGSTSPTWHSCTYERTPNDWALSIATIGAWDYHRASKYSQCLWESARLEAEKTATTPTSPTKFKIETLFTQTK
jgi:hypothetical protein